MTEHRPPAPPAPGRAVRVRVPATVANLGPGFDALGLAVGWHDVVDVAVVETPGLVVEIDGEGAGSLPRDATNLLVGSLLAGLRAEGVDAPAGLVVRCANGVPQGHGLGPSAAAIVAGVLAGQALAAPAEVAVEPDRVAAFRLASRLEGHPDNVAACVFGGLTVAWADGARAHAAALSPAADLDVVVYLPEQALSTVTARALLPTVVDHADAAANAGRAALLVAALTGAADGAALLPATVDLLHQRYRAPAMPATAALLGQLRAAGWAAVVSGSGPAVAVLARGGRPDPPAGPAGFTRTFPGVDVQGAQVQAGPVAS